MAFQIRLIRCTAENNRVNKAGKFVSDWICEGELKDDTSIIRPVITIKKNTPPTISKYNYMEIGTFNRFYFIEDITISYDGFWIITARCDVLMSFNTDILHSKCIIDKCEEEGNANLYYNDGSFIMDARKYNQILEFPNGLPQQGYNILICAGGV